jgi:peptide/nickel transport system permease protein
MKNEEMSLKNGQVEKNISSFFILHSSFYYLGTDNLGRSVLQRLVQGARIAFHVGIVTSLIAIPLGVLLGLLAGYFGRWVDALCNAISTVFASIPTVLFILALAMIAGEGMLGVYLGISLTTWVSVFRVVRAETLKHRERGYVQAAKVLGYGSGRIMFRHILPNVMHVIIVTFAIRFSAAVSTEVFMSFIGIGVRNEPSWGVMINNARVRLWQGIWWEGAAVTLAVFGLVLAFNLLSDDLRDRG